MLSLKKTLGFWPYFFKHWNFEVLLANIGFWPYVYTHLYSYLILSNIGILILLFQSLEFLCYPSTANIGILSIHLYSGPFLYKHCNFYLILSKICILILLFHALEFWPCSLKHWNSYVILPLQSLQFSSYLNTPLLWPFFKVNIGILIFSVQTLVYCSYLS